MNKAQSGENMTYSVSVNSSGQATIPKDIRELLGIVPGENRLVFNVKDGRVTLGREKSTREKFLDSLKKIDKIMASAKQKNPEIAKNIKKYEGMNFEEIRDAYDSSPEGKRKFEEEYGIKL